MGRLAEIITRARKDVLLACAFVGGWLLPRLGIWFGVGIVPVIITATIGAVVLLLILRLIRRL